MNTGDGMDTEDADHTVHRTSRVVQRAKRAFALVVVLVVLALGLTACGGGDSKATSGSPNSSSSSASNSARALEFTQCLRSHGVDVPDPSESSGGNLSFKAPSGSGGGTNPNSPTFQAAMQACQKYSPLGNQTPAQRSQNESQSLRYAQCMRAHGVTNFPDPSTNGAIVMNPSSGINLNSPTVQAANEACKSYAPGAAAGTGS